VVAVDIFESVMELRKQSPEPHYVGFDWDGSLIWNDIEEARLAYMARHNILDVRQDFGHYHSLLASSATRDAYRFCAMTLKGLSIEEVEYIVQRTIEEEGAEITTTELLGHTIAKGIALRPNVVQLMQRFQAARVRVYIVTASSELVVRSAMKYFKLYAPVIGVRNVIENGYVTDKLQEPLPIIEGKVDCIKLHIHPSVRPLLAVGDSINDLPMLEYAQLRAVVDRGDALAVKAKAEGWFLL
jgi:HAD superfamily phosphoserine phosphatase-like hydrolase